VICLTDEPGSAKHSGGSLWWNTMATRFQAIHHTIGLQSVGGFIALGLQLVPPVVMPSPVGAHHPGASASASPPEAVLIADRTRRFPLRREGGGTRAACASRLVAHLVAETGELDPGNRLVIGLIEGSTPQAVPLVLRMAGQDWVLSSQGTATLRLFRLPQPPDDSLWESFPACEGTEEAVAPPARSLLLRPGTRPADRPYQDLLGGLWGSCGRTMATEAVIRGWTYEHLLNRLPKELKVVCDVMPQGLPSRQVNGSLSPS